jgi:dihydroxyacetone kinase
LYLSFVINPFYSSFVMAASAPTASAAGLDVSAVVSRSAVSGQQVSGRRQRVRGLHPVLHF